MRCAAVCLTVTALFTVHANADNRERCFRDPGEAELVSSIRLETDSAKRLDMLHRWEAKYPATDFSQERYGMLLAALQQLGHPKAMLQTAMAMVRDDPRGLGQYWVATLTIALQDTSPQALERGEQAAQALIRNLPVMFAGDKRPEAVSMAAWIEERQRIEAAAHRTLGWVAYNRRKWGQAERELILTLRYDKEDAEASFWMGASILSDGAESRRARGLYYVARSLAVTGAGALTTEARTVARTYLEQQYRAAGGDPQGVERLVAMAKHSAFPPANFRL